MLAISIMWILFLILCFGNPLPKKDRERVNRIYTELKEINKIDKKILKMLKQIKNMGE